MAEEPDILGPGDSSALVFTEAEMAVGMMTGKHPLVNIGFLIPIKGIMEHAGKMGYAPIVVPVEAEL